MADMQTGTIRESVIAILGEVRGINTRLDRMNGSIEAVTGKAHQHDLDIQELRGEDKIQAEKTKILQDVNAAQGKRVWDVIQGVIQWAVIAILALKLFAK